MHARPRPGGPNSEQARLRRRHARASARGYIHFRAGENRVQPTKLDNEMIMLYRLWQLCVATLPFDPAVLEYRVLGAGPVVQEQAALTRCVLVHSSKAEGAKKRFSKLTIDSANIHDREKPSSGDL
jgi:hypothetical protein